MNPAIDWLSEPREHGSSDIDRRPHEYHIVGDFAQRGSYTVPPSFRFCPTVIDARLTLPTNLPTSRLVEPVPMSWNLRVLARCLAVSMVLLNGVSLSKSDAQTTPELLASSSSPSLPAKAFSSPTANHSASQGFRGTLLICGGGAIARRIREEFHEAGKGPEGSLVLIPTASPRSDSGDFEPWLDYWASFQWKGVSVVHANDREHANDPSLAQSIRNATAVWISGGDQSRLSERYVGTAVEHELHSLLVRGGIIGGTSAGAAIASSLMISGGLAEPQFRDGFRFVPGAIIDQHFSEKRRYERLVKAVQSHPQHIGLGLDESTGLFITHEDTRVVGDGSVYLLNPKPDPRTLIEPSQPNPTDIQSTFTKLRDGDRISSKDLPLFQH